MENDRVRVLDVRMQPGATSATSVEQSNELIAGTRLVLAPASIERLNQASAS